MTQQLKIVPQKATGRVRIIQDDHNGCYFKGEEYDVYNYGKDLFAAANCSTFMLIQKDRCELIPMDEYKDMKFRIHSPEHSETLQKHLFNLGVHWTGTSVSTVMYTHLPFIYIGPRGWLEYTDDENVFNDLKCVEYELQSEVMVKHTLVPVEPRKTVVIGDHEYDESYIQRALKAYKDQQ